MKAIPIRQLLSWLFGVIVLIIVSTMILNNLKEHTQVTYDPSLYYWIRFGLYLIIGAAFALAVLKLELPSVRYLGLLMLILAIIALIIAISLPFVSVVQINFNSEFLNRLIKFSYYGWITILSGFLLVTSGILIIKTRGNI